MQLLQVSPDRPSKAQAGGGIARARWTGGAGEPELIFIMTIGLRGRLYSPRPQHSCTRCCVQPESQLGHWRVKNPTVIIIILNLQFIPGWNRAVVLVHFL